MLSERWLAVRVLVAAAVVIPCACEVPRRGQHTALDHNHSRNHNQHHHWDVAPTSTGRYTVAANPAGRGWTLLSPGGEPTFVVALNHLASPFYYDVIQGANGLA